MKPNINSVEVPLDVAPGSLWPPPHVSIMQLLKIIKDASPISLDFRLHFPTHQG